MLQNLFWNEGFTLDKPLIAHLDRFDLVYFMCSSEAIG
jgi:hypothetical protein